MPQKFGRILIQAQVLVISADSSTIGPATLVKQSILNGEVLKNALCFTWCVHSDNIYALVKLFDQSK